MTLLVKNLKKITLQLSPEHLTILIWKVPIMSSELNNLHRCQGSSLIRHETQKAERHHEITQTNNFTHRKYEGIEEL